MPLSCRERQTDGSRPRSRAVMFRCALVLFSVLRLLLCFLDPIFAFRLCFVDPVFNTTTSATLLDFSFPQRFGATDPVFNTTTSATLLDFSFFLQRFGSTTTPPAISNIFIMTAQLQCFNCNIRLYANRQSYDILDMSPDIVSLLEEWTTRQVSTIDRLCQECFDLVIAEVVDGHNRPQQQLGHHSLCVDCGISLAQRSGRLSRPLLDGCPERVYIARIIFPRQIPVDARVCNPCWLRARYRVQRDSEVHDPPIEQGDEQDPENADLQEPDIVDELHHESSSTMTLAGFSRTPDTASHCFVPECTNMERFRVPKYLRKRILADYKVFIPANSRVCEQHSSVYNWDVLNDYEFITNFTSPQIVDMLNILCESKTDSLNFENVENMEPSICHYWTGLSIVNFLILFNLINNGLNNCKRKKTALALYLVKIRTGESFARIASIFQITTSVVRSYVKKVRNCLTSVYVPLHLGVGHISREVLSARNLIIPRGLFGTELNNPIVIMDGTYIYVQKSSNYLFQKKTYSLHKFRNLVKPFLIVATDGHIVDAYGPYPATTTDADILKQLFENENSDLRSYFTQNDVFILDRGFRDALGLLNSLGYSVYKPETRSENEGSQLSTIKANKSRLVTMCRWVVEVVNGRFKRDYKIFRANYFNNMSENLMQDFRIAAAIINHFHPVITDRPDAEPILQRALERLDTPNHLADHVQQLHLNRHRANFIRIDGQVPQLDMFPVMEMSDLVLFALGTYQIKQARSYYGEHIRTNGTFVIEVNDSVTVTNVPGISSSHDTLLIRGRIRSRHHSNTVYYTYILLNSGEANWRDQICGYYCSCIIGKRTVGTCAHVMTIVWYLGWARHQDSISAPATFLDGVLVMEDE